MRIIVVNQPLAMRYLMGARVPGVETLIAQELEDLRAALGVSSIHTPFPTVLPGVCTPLKQAGLLELGLQS